MTLITQKSLPQDMHGAMRLPGIQPVTGSWITVDEAYPGQMREREALLGTARDAVLAQPPAVLGPARELLDMLIPQLASVGFDVAKSLVTCPDERRVLLDRDDPLGTIGRLLQCDVCLHEKVGAEHVLQGAVLCFPASWTLAQKIGKPLSAIHAPVKAYNADLARRVQRMFDGVRVGQPLWRYNQLWYEAPDLFAPRDEDADLRHVSPGPGRFFRTERQTILRLPLCGWVVFAIHTYVLAYDDAPRAVGGAAP